MSEITIAPASGEIIPLLTKLISIDTCQPDGNELDAVQYIASLFQEKSALLKVLDHGANRASLIVKIAGRKQGHGIMFAGHLDTVPVGNAASWRFPPHMGHVENGVLHGRGATDMKGGVVACILTALKILESAAPPPVDLCFAFTADEEHRGIGALALGREKSFIGSIKELVISEPTDLAVAVAEKGALWLKVRATGKSCHASMPDSGVNALDALVSFASSLQNSFHDLVKVMPPHPFLGQASCALTECRGGVSTNVIPPDGEMAFDIRTLPNMENRDLLTLAHKTADSLMKSQNGLEMKIEILNDRPALACPPEAPMLHDLQTTFKNRDIPFKETGVNYYTDAAQIIPVFGIEQFAIVGPGRSSDCHQLNESVSIESISKATALYLDFIYSRGR